MKPKINLKSDIVQLVFNLYQKQVMEALEIEQTIEKAVIPICAVPISKAHQKQKVKPIQIGSGVLVKIKDQFFIFSATHVFEEFNDKALFTSPPGIHIPMEQISGERLSSGNIKNRIDKHDASVYHIQSEISQPLKSLAISLDDIDFDGYDPIKPIFMITGFRIKESNTKGNKLKFKARNFATIELDEYDLYGYNKESQILLAFEDYILLNDKWVKSPSPRGMSGGAIIKSHGTSNNKTKENKKQLLTAITTEQHREKNKKMGYLLGTRINVFLGLIHNYMPEILEEFLKSYRENEELK